MLAALETLTSLEPDYSDEIAAEASVTIIECAGYDAVAEALGGDAGDGRSLRARLHDFVDAPDPALHDYDDFSGPGDEATVEIVEGLTFFRCTRAGPWDAAGQSVVARRAHRRRYRARAPLAAASSRRCRAAADALVRHQLP